MRFSERFMKLLRGLQAEEVTGTASCQETKCHTNKSCRVMVVVVVLLSSSCLACWLLLLAVVGVVGVVAVVVVVAVVGQQNTASKTN
jgi:hypothetical protein